MKTPIILAAVLLFVSAPAVFAMKECGDPKLDCAKCHTLTVAEANDLLKEIGGGVQSVKMAPVKGLWELALEKDGRKGVVYMNFGKKFIMAGPVFQIDALKAAIQAQAAAQAKAPQPKLEKVDVATIPLTNSIVMGNPKGKKRLFVFTDPECPFCARQHAELQKLVELDKDVAVYVKFFPLVSIHPKSYDKARVILEQNSIELLDKAFARGAVPEPKATTPTKGVDETLNFAQSIGINATPTLVFPDGRIVPGAMDAAAIEKQLTN